MEVSFVKTVLHSQAEIVLPSKKSDSIKRFEKICFCALAVFSLITVVLAALTLGLFLGQRSQWMKRSSLFPLWFHRSRPSSPEGGDWGC